MAKSKPLLIKNKSVTDDDWTVLRVNAGDSVDNVAISPGKIIVPLKVWQAQQTTLRDRTDLGVWLACDAALEELGSDLGYFAVIAIDFPIFTDGRGYSLAYQLRVRLGYRGELRAIGDVLRDQLFYLQRVGFDAFTPRPDRDIHDALKGLSDFSERYQPSWDEPFPLSRRVTRKTSKGAWA